MPKGLPGVQGSPFVFPPSGLLPGIAASVRRRREYAAGIVDPARASAIGCRRDPSRLWGFG
jgi:hypothetical protein